MAVATAVGEGFSTGAVPSGGGTCGLGREGATRLTAQTPLLPPDFLTALSIGQTQNKARR